MVVKNRQIGIHRVDVSAPEGEQPMTIEFKNLLIKISDGGQAAIFEGPYFIGNVLATHAACSIQEYKRHWSANVCLDVAGGSLLGQLRFARGNCGLNFRTKYRVVEENVIAMGE